MRRYFVLKAGLELAGAARPEFSEPRFVVELPSPLRRAVELNAPPVKAVIAGRQCHSLSDLKRLEQSFELSGIVELKMVA